VEFSARVIKYVADFVEESPDDEAVLAAPARLLDDGNAPIDPPGDPM